MKNTMTYAVALSTAIDAMKDTNPAVVERLTALREALAKRSEHSDEAKAKRSAQRKEQTAKVRAELMANVLPVLRKGLSATQIGITAKELYDLMKNQLPEDFTAGKVQYILLHELANEVEKIETKNKPNLYKMKEA